MALGNKAQLKKKKRIAVKKKKIRTQRKLNETKILP